MVLHCINKAIDQGALSKAEGDKIIQDFDNLVQQHSNGVANNLLAGQNAKTQLVITRQAELANKKIRVVRQAQAEAHIAANLSGHGDVKGRVDAIFTPSATERHGDIRSLEYTIKGYEKMSMAHMAEGLANIKKNFVNDATKMEQLDVLREAQKISTGNKAAEILARGYEKGSDFLDDALRSFGINVPKSDVRGVPHAHSSYKVGKATKDQWIDFTMPLLDRDKMLVKLHDVDPMNYSGLTMTDAELRTLLGNIYDNIRTNGLNQSTSGFKPGASIVNKYNKERILHFKDDGWFTYNERFGEMDIVHSMYRDLQNKSRDVGMMESFGPNVNAGAEYLKMAAVGELQKQRAIMVKNNGGVEKQLTLKDKLPFMGDRNVKAYDKMVKMEKGMNLYIKEWMDIAEGKTFGDLGPNAKTWDNARGFLASAQLGTATLAAGGDFGTMKWTAHYNGLDFSKVMKAYFDALTAGASKDELRVFAAEQMMILDHMQANLLNQAHYETDKFNTLGGILTDRVLRWSGLVRHTESGRIAFSTVMHQEIAANFGKSFDQLGRELKRGLKINGIDAKAWDDIRSSAPITRDGVDHLHIGNVYDINPDAALRINQYVSSETDKALIASGWKFDRVAKNWTPGGQMGKNMTMYKRWPVLMMMHHVGRMLSPEMTGGERAAYVAGLTATMTVLGAVSITLKDLAAGRDPRSWDSGGFWVDAFFAGGVGGVVADFAKTGYDAVRQKRSSDAITSLVGGAFGPIIGAIGDLASPYQALLLGIANDDAPQTIAQATAAASAKWTKYVPGNTFWPTRIFVDRWFDDQAQYLMNKDARKYFKKQIDNRQNFYDGQKFWWKPGDALPSGLPDWGSNGK